MQTRNEFIDSAAKYGLAVDDPLRVAFNFVYHFGTIFDYVMELVYMLSGNVMLNEAGYRQIGVISGSIAYNLFYATDDYEYPDVTINYPSDSLNWTLNRLT